MERKIKGSYTVEMAMISGVWLLILFASLLLLLGSYQRVWDTAGACEIAVYGSTMAVTRGTDGVEKAGQTSRAKEDTYVVSGNKQEIQVSFDKNLKIPFQNLSWRRKTSVKSKIIRPVLFIEKVQKARKIASGFG